MVSDRDSITITSLQNPLVKQMRKLHRAKERHSQQEFLLEGTHLLESACQVAFKLSTVCYTHQWGERHPQLFEQVRSLAERVVMVSPEVLSAIATTVNPDGVVATAQAISRISLPCEEINLGIALERLQDPGNLGTIIRTAAATHVEGIWMSADSVDLDNPKVLRSSAGAWFRVPMAVSSNLMNVVKKQRQAGMQIIATMPQAERTYWEVDLCRPTLILLGNEGAGLSTELSSLADHQVRIPLGSGVESLNVAIATALLLYESLRQRQQS